MLFLVWCLLLLACMSSTGFQHDKHAHCFELQNHKLIKTIIPYATLRLLDLLFADDANTDEKRKLELAAIARNAQLQNAGINPLAISSNTI